MFLLNVLYYVVIFAVVTAALCYAVADYLTRRFTSLHDLKYLNSARPDGEKGKHAVVMGGSLAGIMTARILLDHFEKVTIIENDDYDKPNERVRGAVAQGAHAHLMLAIATTSLKTMFAGIEAIFKARGGRVSDLGVAMKWFYWSSFRVRCKMDYPFWCCSRPFLDKVVREFFFENYSDRITVLTRRRIVDPVLSTDLPTLLADVNKQSFTKTGIPVSGHYSQAASVTSTSDEFRVVGVYIKRRPEETSSNGIEDVYEVVTTPSDDKVSDENYHTSVRIPRPEVEHEEEYILGDLVVDCTGAAATADRWAKKWGLEIPTSEIKATSMYVSHLFKEPEGFDADWICNPVYPTPGLSAKFGYVMRIERGLWQVTGMATAGQTVDNTSVDTFREHFNDLDHPHIYDLLTTPVNGKAPEPVSGEKLHTYYPKVYIRRHFEMCPQMPEGLVAVGNSVCVFDPMYGQGMSGACIAALALNRTLVQPQFRGAKGLVSNGFARTYFQIMGDRLEFPWMLCAGEDSRWYPNIKSKGPRAPEKPYFLMSFLKFWIRQGMILAEKHPLAQSTAMGIMNMTVSFTSLLNPPLVYLVLKNVVLEALGMTYTPEEKYKKEVEPAKLARQKKVQ